MHCVYNQSVFLFAFDPQQLPAFSASKASGINPRVNTYENQYILSLAERLCTLEWPIIVMDQQFRMLPGLFDPARDVFYERRNIQDVMVDDADTSIATIVECWVMARGASPPPSGKFWPAFLIITDTQCKKVKGSKSSMNKEMWHLFFAVLWHDFLTPEAEFRVDCDKLCILSPYRAMTTYIEEYLPNRGLYLITSTVNPWKDAGNVNNPVQDEALA